MDLINVKFNEEEQIGIVYLNNFPLYSSFGKTSIKEFKNSFIKWISNEFDESIRKELGLSFPYVIGGLTFYSLSEIEKYIEGTQNLAKD